MEYKVVKRSLKTGNEINHGEYVSEENAIKAVEELNENPSKRARILYRPDNIGVGYEIYLTDDEYYGTILYETEHFYYVSKEEDAELIDCDFFNKEGFESKFDDGIFKPIDGKEE